MYRYLRQAKMLTKKGNVRKAAEVGVSVRKMAETHQGGDPASQWHRDHAAEHLENIAGFEDLEMKKGPEEVFKFGTCMPASRSDPSELRDFLQRNAGLRSGTFNGTQYAKLACYLDWLENGDQS